MTVNVISVTKWVIEQINVLTEILTQAEVINTLAQIKVVNNHVSQENATTVEERDISVLIVGKRKRIPTKGRQIIE